MPVSNSRARQGLGDVAGLPGGTLVVRGDCLWAHTTLTVEPAQNKGRSPEKAAEASSSGSAEGTMALSLLCHHLRASSSLPCRAAQCERAPRGSQPQERWSGAGPRKGTVCPEGRKERTQVTGRNSGVRSSQWPLAGLPRGLPHLERSERFAGGPPSGRVWTTWLTPPPYTFPSAHDGPANEQDLSLLLAR